MASEASITNSIVVESRASAIDEICNQILTSLHKSSFSQDDIFAIHLALEEAFINAVKHGNKMDPAKTVKIDYSIAPDKVEISVTDEGEGFDPELIPDPRVGKNLFKPEGRGLFLMNSYMDIVEFTGNGKCLHMVRYREKPPLMKSRDEK